MGLTRAQIGITSLASVASAATLQGRSQADHCIKFPTKTRSLTRGYIDTVMRFGPLLTAVLEGLIYLLKCRSQSKSWAFETIMFHGVLSTL